MSKLAAFFLSLVASVSVFAGSATPYYCTSMAGHWMDGSNIFSYSVTQNGTQLGGTANYDCVTCSPVGWCYYAISGLIRPFSATSINTTTLTLTLNSGGPLGCVPTNTTHWQIKLGTVGCAVTTSVEDGHSVLNETSCTIPGGGSGVGEGPSHFLGWKTSPGVALALFKAGPLVTPINGSTFDWSGRTVTEQLSPGPQTCSAGYYDLPTPIPWYLDGNYLGDGANGNPPDGIGPTSPDANVIPNREKAAGGGETLPCSYTTDQYMYVDCPANLGGHAAGQFEHHQIVYTIGPDYISVKRGSEPSSNQPYGPSENSFKLPPTIITYLLRHH